MELRYKTLLTPLKLPNGVWLKNRMVHPKCAPDQIQGPEEWPTEAFIHFHREAARRGNSLVIVCDAFRPEVRKMPAWHDFSHSYSFDLANPAVHNYFCQLADDIHFYGSKCLVETHPAFPRGVSLGGVNPPFMQSAEGMMKLPPVREATKEEIQEVIDKTVATYVQYQQWGFDGAAVNATGLEHQTDGRTDEYGGSSANRCRFTVELCKAIKKACGKKFIIHLIMEAESPHGGFGGLKDGYYLEDTIELSRQLQEAGVVDLISLREDSLVTSHPTGFTYQKGEHKSLDYCRAYKKAGITVPVAPCGGFQLPDEMEEILESGDADLISVGRGMFTDADYLTKIQEGRGEDIRPCVKCNRCHGRRRAPWTSVCTVNPEFGSELKDRHMTVGSGKHKKVAVIGAGPAGMQAALTAAERGHQVVLFEKTDYLGGQLSFGDYFTFKWPFKEYRLWMIEQLKKAGVEIRLNTAPAPEDITAEGFDAVIAATGSKAKLPPIPGMRKEDGTPAVKTCHDVIGNHESVGKNLVMVGCSETGVETACYLAMNGHNITCLTRQNQLAKDASPLHSITIAWVKEDKEKGYSYMAPYWEHFDNLTGITNATTVSVTPHSVTYRDADGAEHTLECDDVIACGGVEACADEAVKYATCTPEFYMVGDADGAGDIQKSVRGGFAAASNL